MAFTPDGNHFLYSSWSDYSEYAPDFYWLSSPGPEVSRMPTSIVPGLYPFSWEDHSQGLTSLPFVPSPAQLHFHPPSPSSERFLSLLPFLVHICNIYGEGDTHTALDLRYWLPSLGRLIRNFSRGRLSRSKPPELELLLRGRKYTGCKCLCADSWEGSTHPFQPEEQGKPDGCGIISASSLR